MVDGGGVRNRPKQSRLTIEDYVDFINSEKQLDLKVGQLNQIMYMHGYNKFHKTHKSDLIEAVKKIDLMDPTRSTLQDYGVSSDAFIDLKDVIKDVNELKWQECCITSLQTINAVNHHEGSLNDGGTAGTIVSASSAKPRKSRKRIRTFSQTGGGKDVVPSSFNLGGSETASCSSAVVNWVPRRKKTVKCDSVNGNGNNGVVNFGVGFVASVAAGEVQPLAASLSALIALDE